MAAARPGTGASNQASGCHLAMLEQAASVESPRF